MNNTLKITTWNVNSVKARMSNVLEFLNEYKPDVVLLQELKCQEEAFPYMEIEELGYNCAVFGQKTYNGVAILSKYPLEDIKKGLPEFPEEQQARYIEALVNANGDVFRVASVYVPNGMDEASEKFQYKLEFFGKLYNHLNNIRNLDEKIIIGGDYNVAHKDIDVYDPIAFKNSICFLESEKTEFTKILNNKYLDLYRAYHPDTQAFSWWDYRANSWGFNKGMRIDYLLTNPMAADASINCEIISEPRGKEKASDHTPVMAKFKIKAA